MNDKVVKHLIESLKERKASSERKIANGETIALNYHTGRIDAFKFAIELIELWAKIS